MKLLIVDNYDSFTFNLVQLVEEAGYLDYLLVKNDKILAIDSRKFNKVLISPGPGIASEAGELPDFIKKYYRTKSMLGVCLGFEALGEFFGALLKPLPRPLHGYRNKGKVLNDTLLFRRIPESFFIGHYHSWYFDKNRFPETLQVVMTDETGMIMAFQHRKYPLYGVQFHPESVMTEFGKEIIFNWLSV